MNTNPYTHGGFVQYTGLSDFGLTDNIATFKAAPIPPKPIPDYEVVLFTDGERLADSLAGLLHQQPKHIRIVTPHLPTDPQANMLTQNLIGMGSNIFLDLQPKDFRSKRWQIQQFCIHEIFIRMDDDSAILEAKGLDRLAQAAFDYGVAIPTFLDTSTPSAHDYTVSCIAMRTATAAMYLSDTVDTFPEGYPYDAYVLDELLPFDVVRVVNATLATLGLRNKDTAGIHTGNYMEHLASTDYERYLETVIRMQGASDRE